MANKDEYVKPPKKNNNDYVAPPKNNNSKYVTPPRAEGYVAPPTSGNKEKVRDAKKDYVAPPKNGNAKKQSINRRVGELTDIEPPQNQGGIRRVNNKKEPAPQNNPSNNSGCGGFLRVILFIIIASAIYEFFGSDIEAISIRLYGIFRTSLPVSNLTAEALADIVKYIFYFALYWIIGGNILRLVASMNEVRKRYSIFTVLISLIVAATLYTWSGFIGGVVIVIIVLGLIGTKE